MFNNWEIYWNLLYNIKYKEDILAIEEAKRTNTLQQLVIEAQKQIQNKNKK